MNTKKIAVAVLVLLVGGLAYNAFAACSNPSCECTCADLCEAPCEDCNGGIAAGCCTCCGDGQCCDVEGAGCGGWPFYSPRDSECGCKSC